MRNNKNKPIIISVSFIVLLFLVSTSTFENNPKNSNIDFQPSSSASLSGEQEWITNRTFVNQQPWYESSGLYGDQEDINAEISGEKANFEIVGEKREFNNISGIPDSENWTITQNPLIKAYPDNNETDSFGCYIYNHRYTESADQYVSTHWDREIRMGINMQNYYIDSAKLSIKINASADPNIDTPKDTYCKYPAENDDDKIDQYHQFDYARFYVLFSDMEKNFPIEVLYYQTVYLGQQNESLPTITLLNDKILEASEDGLIDALESIFEFNENNFTLTLGIDIFCEDNNGYGIDRNDHDYWNYLRIKECNFSFTYEKKIDQLTSVSWNQDCDPIDSLKINSGDQIQIDNADLNFSYKFDKPFPDISFNSELRILLNDREFDETINLNDIGTSYSQANFDLTSLIKLDNDVNFSIQLYIGDNFGLDDEYIISIDNVSLVLSYTRYFGDYSTDLEVFIDNQNKTSDKTIIVPVGIQLNISTMYFDGAENHISNAEVYLTGEGLTENFEENLSLNLYYLNFNTSKLKLGDNYLTIYAEKNNYLSQNLEVAIILRKINSTISSVDSSDVINTQPGEDVNISIALNNNDFGGNIKNATVTYTWAQGSGILKDSDYDGIYEGTVENVPEGTFTVKVTAFAGDDYNIQDYEITISSYIKGGGGLNWVIYILVGAMAGISGYIVLYQKVLRYPPTVRKVRKLRKRIQKDKTLKPMKVKDRSSIIQKSLTEEKTHAVLKKEEERIPKEDKITEKLEDSKVIKIEEEAKDSPKNPDSSKK